METQPKRVIMKRLRYVKIAAESLKTISHIALILTLYYLPLIIRAKVRYWWVRRRVEKHLRSMGLDGEESRALAEVAVPKFSPWELASNVSWRRVGETR